MVRRDIYRARQKGDILTVQSYPYSIQDKYLKPQRTNMGKYLRSMIVKGAHEMFMDPDTTSASRLTSHIAAKEDGEYHYNLRKESDAIPFVMERYSGCSHYFSQICLESMGWVEAKEARKRKEMDFIPDAMNQHEDVQNYFMTHGYAEAMEVPAWIGKDEAPFEQVERTFAQNENLTCYIDLLVYWKGEWWILDYKPGAAEAKSKFAAAQLLACREMLAWRTGQVKLNIAYFDQKDTFIWTD